MRRNVGRLTISAAYTYSHSIDDSSDRGDGTFVNSYDFAANRASSNFDQRHVFNFSYVWDLPLFRQPGLANKFLGGWQWSGITTVASGSPFTPSLTPTMPAWRTALPGSGISPGSCWRSHAPELSKCRGRASVRCFITQPRMRPARLDLWGRGQKLLDATHAALTSTWHCSSTSHSERAGLSSSARKPINVFNHTEWGALAGGGGSGAGAVNSGTNVLDSSGFLTHQHRPQPAHPAVGREAHLLARAPQQKANPASQRGRVFSAHVATAASAVPRRRSRAAQEVKPDKRRS